MKSSTLPTVGVIWLASQITLGTRGDYTVCQVAQGQLTLYQSTHTFNVKHVHYIPGVYRCAYCINGPRSYLSSELAGPLEWTMRTETAIAF